MTSPAAMATILVAGARDAKRAFDAPRQGRKTTRSCFRRTLSFSSASISLSHKTMNEEQTIEAARRNRLNQGLMALASWCQSRAMGDHDIETTLKMLTTKVEKLPWRVVKAGADALEEFRDNQTQP